MKQDVVNSFLKRQGSFLLPIGLWIAYVLIHIAFKQSEKTLIYAGFLAFIGQVGLNLVIASLTFLLWKRTTGQEKTIFAFFSISFLLLAIADANYNVIVNILGIINSLITAKVSFIGFLILQFLVWVIIFSKSKPTQNSRFFLISYLPVIMIMLIIFTFFFLANLTWKVQVCSLIGLYCLLNVIFQITGFVFALLCLAIAANKQIRFIATGYLIVIAISFFTESSHLTQNRLLLPLSWTEVMWFLGLLLITFGFNDMFRNLSNLKMDRWLNSLNSVQAQCAFWSFVLCMLLLTAFCGILTGYNLLKLLPLEYLPSILIMFSVFAVLISSILARVLSSPFERVKVIIDSYMNGKEINTTQVRKTGSNVYEFELLENFLTRSFEVLKEKNKAQLELFNCATQVAHDIRSPLAALDMISKLLTELPEEKRVIIRNAVQRINDIANNLLETHRLKGKSKPAEIIEDTKPELVSSLLDSLTLEKRIQLAHKSINLILEIQNAAYSSFINLEAREFKRVISNLINNASEAIHGTDGVIRLTLEKESNMLIIKIIDNGKGIPADLLPKIKQGGMSIGKKKGAGLGISGAIQNIKKWNGTYDIQSKEGEGTTFIIKLPITEAPDWFQNRLDITLGMNIIVLDDDQSIHDVWETRFQEYIKNGQISLEHFYLPSEFVKYCEVLATPTCPAEAESEGGSYAKAGINLPSTKTLFLIDYELLGSEETGLDLIEKLKLKDHAILVTSRYEEPKIRDKIINLGIKAIPKNFAPYIIINY